MTDIHTYIMDAIKLANSVIFKFNHINVYINYNLLTRHGVTQANQQDSKYYLNMAGLPYKTDRDIITYIPDIKADGVITKDNIKNYPVLYNELLQKGTTYKTLLSKYRRENSLIKGILNPIDLSRSINAKDGTILEYDRTLLSENEFSLIKELEDFIKTFLGSYYNKKYNVDEYYIPGFLSALYNNLPLQIIRIRLSKIFTIEVDDFNLYAYLLSNKNITKDSMSFMNKESILWLYGNLKHLNKRIGHNRILDSVLTNIYDKNYIGVSKLDVSVEVPVVNDINDRNNVYYTKQKLLINDKANNSCKTIGDKHSIADILKIETALKYINNKNVNIVYTDNNKQLDKITTDTNTKVFLFDIADITIFYKKSVFNLLFNNLLYYIKQDNFTINTLFLNPTDNIYINVDQKSIFYIILYCLTILKNGTINDIYISDYNIDGVLTKNIDPNQLVKNTILKDKLLPIVNDILSIINNSPLPTDSTTFSNRINTIKRVYSKIWYYITNTNDIVISSDLKKVFNNFIKSYTIDEDNTKNLRELIDLHVGVGFTITKELANTTLINLCKDIFNIDVDIYLTIDNTFKKYVNFVNKFKSYTVQFLYDKSYLKTAFTYSNSIDIGQQHRTIGNVYNAYFRKNENIHTVLNSINIAYWDKSIFTDELVTPYELHYEHNGVLNANINDISVNTEVYMVDNYVNVPIMHTDITNAEDVYETKVVSGANINSIEIQTNKYNSAMGVEESILENLEVYSQDASFNIMDTTLHNTNTVYDTEIISNNSVINKIGLATNEYNSTKLIEEDMLDDISIYSQNTHFDIMGTALHNTNTAHDAGVVSNSNIVPNINIEANDYSNIMGVEQTLLENLESYSKYSSFNSMGTTLHNVDLLQDVSVISNNSVDKVDLTTNEYNSTKAVEEDMLEDTNIYSKDSSFKKQ